MARILQLRTTAAKQRRREAGEKIVLVTSSIIIYTLVRPVQNLAEEEFLNCYAASG
jgi:hypothetical protein